MACVAEGESPDELRGEEAVVQALVRSEVFRRLGELGGEAESLPPVRRIPEERFEDEEVDVEGGDEADQDVR